MSSNPPIPPILNLITLTDYDIVVAVTQASINEALASYLSQLQKNVALYYNVDATGDFVPATDPSTADYIFTGTLAYTVNADGSPVDLVQLYTDQGSQTVIYNITFSNAEFKSTVAPLFDVTQQTGANPWIIQFHVDLTTQELDLTSLPQATQTMILNAVNNVSTDMFSIQQLYLDLNNADFATFENIEGMTSFAGSILSGIMQSYLATLQSSGGILFGLSVTATAANVTPPTFMPTAFDFCVTPYTDPEGAHSIPTLDTLNYLVMVNTNALPANPPTAFGFNWVDDKSIQGAMAIRHGLFISYLIEQLNPILKTMCPVCYVKADAKHSINDQTMLLNPGSDNTFTIASTPTNGVVASCSYASPQANDSNTVLGGTESLTLNYSMTCDVSLAGSTVTLSGNILVSADSSTSDENGGGVDEAMPPTTYSWSVDLVLQMDPANNGQLDFSIQNPNFSSQPTVDPEHQSAWDKFINAVGGVFKIFAQDPGGIREAIQSNVTSNILPALTAAVNTANDFVFPGGNTFLFKNPQFSDTDELAANITYLTPAPLARTAVKAGG